MTNLVPGAILQLEPADWREPTTRRHATWRVLAGPLMRWWKRRNRQPLHLQITRTNWGRSLSDGGIWVHVEGHDLDADGVPLGSRTAYVRLAATANNPPSPPN